jgi:hypothetical protein
MKKLIRKGIFETNSSSSHSVSIADEDKEFVLDTIYPNQHGTIIVRGDEYGWDWFKHNDAETKASYAAQQFSNDSDMLEKLEYVIKEQTGAERVIFEGLNDGYVDHDSVGILPRTARELKNFIFNKNSWLFGGNDNSEASPEFYHVPEYKEGRLIQPEFKYELSIDGLKQTAKFVNKPNGEELQSAISSLLGDALLTENGTFIIDNSIMWQISRDRDYYEYYYRSNFDSESREILFKKENTYSEQNNIQKKLEGIGKLEGLDWRQKEELFLEEMLKVPGLIKKVKFTLNEI